jgi:TMEM175 potassium channel family protein
MNRFRAILIRWEKKAANFLALLHLSCSYITFKQAGLLGYTLSVINTVKPGIGCQSGISWEKLGMAEPQEQRAESSLGLERILFFSDAVFAIAITLLVLNIEVPDIPQGLVAEELPDRLLGLWPKYLSYVISFLVIFVFWISHHSIFNHFKGYDRKLMWLNALFLMGIAFLPFPSALLGKYGDQQLVVVIYAASVAVTRFMLSAVWWYSWDKPQLVSLSMEASTVRAFHVRALYIPLVFLLSIGISFFSISAAMYSWILLLLGDSVILYVLRR